MKTEAKAEQLRPMLPLGKCLLPIWLTAIVGMIGWIMSQYPLFLLGVIGPDGLLPHGSLSGATPLEALGAFAAIAVFYTIFPAWLYTLPVAGIIAGIVELSARRMLVSLAGSIIVGVIVMEVGTLYVQFLGGHWTPHLFFQGLISGAVMGTFYFLATRKRRKQFVASHRTVRSE